MPFLCSQPSEETSTVFAGSIEEYGRACEAKGWAEADAERAEFLRRNTVKQLQWCFNEVPEYLVLRLGAVAYTDLLDRLFDDTCRIDSLREFDALLA